MKVEIDVDHDFLSALGRDIGRKPTQQDVESFVRAAFSASRQEIVEKWERQNREKEGVD